MDDLEKALERNLDNGMALRLELQSAAIQVRTVREKIDKNMKEYDDIQEKRRLKQMHLLDDHEGISKTLQ